MHEEQCHLMDTQMGSLLDMLIWFIGFEREINEFNEVQCVYFLPLLSWLSYSTAGYSLCICHTCKNEVYNLELPLTYK